jgi:glyoxylase-like metal-dependent hydrolase (beta-lactamase superfamily II)
VVWQHNLAADKLAGLIGTPDEPFLLDVRERDEVATWALPRAVNIPLGELAARVGDIPSDRHVVAVCASGSRSAHATRFLLRHGHRVSNLSGGMAAWGQVYDEAEVGAGAARIVQLRRRGKGCISYLVGAGGEAFAIDPSVESDRYLDAARRYGWRVSRVFDTHLHADHVSGARQLAKDAHASLHLNPADAFEFAFEPLEDGARFALPGGAELAVGALHTPGHTTGSTVYVLDGHAVLSGDTLFVDGVGRPDLADRAEEFARSLYRSLHDKVLPLPDETLVLPAHYGDEMRVAPGEVVAARLGDLRTRLDQLSLDEEGFVAWAAARATPRPPNYVEIVKTNMGRAHHSHRSAAHLEAGPNRCSL